MPIRDIDHIAIRTEDVEATDRFYVDILGMTKIDRPDFGFPGSWIRMGSTMIHTMGGDMCVDPKDGKFHTGSAAVDHIAVAAQGFDEMKQRLVDHGLEWREFDIPDFGIMQLFAKDPNGIIIEMNFKVADEPEGTKGCGEGIRYEPGGF